MKHGKIWGTTQEIFEWCGVEMHLINVKGGHTCSLHKHHYRHNGFMVISGQLVIETHKNDYELIDKTVLGPGERTVCRSGEFHRFIATEDTVAVEWYWVELDHSDIERMDHGRKIDESDQ